MSTVIVFGAMGLLGANLVPLLRARGHNVLTQSRDSGGDLCLNPFDHVAVVAALTMYRPAAVINLVAATNVDECETQTELAWKANAGVVAAISEGIMALYNGPSPRPHLVHISTDQVYDGQGPHSEGEVNPINVYGLSKYTGELLADRVGATVLRSNFYGRSRCLGRLSFSDWLVKSFRDKAAITVFDDIKFSALHIDTLCDIVEQCIGRRPKGVFNAGCRDSISKAGFALALASELGLSTNQVTVGRSTDVLLKARRPLDMSLQVSKLENILNFKLPIIKSQIEITAQEYLNEQTLF
jgi:dTDP-4-dehydrorhamnose reductase